MLHAKFSVYGEHFMRFKYTKYAYNNIFRTKHTNSYSRNFIFRIRESTIETDTHWRGQRHKIRWKLIDVICSSKKNNNWKLCLFSNESKQIH